MLNSHLLWSSLRNAPPFSSHNSLLSFFVSAFTHSSVFSSHPPPCLTPPRRPHTWQPLCDFPSPPLTCRSPACSTRPPASPQPRFFPFLTPTTQRWQLSVTLLGVMATASQLHVVRNETCPECQDRPELLKPHSRRGSLFVFNVTHKFFTANILRRFDLIRHRFSSSLPRTPLSDHSLKKFRGCIAKQTQLQLRADFLCEFDAIIKFLLIWFDFSHKVTPARHVCKWVHHTENLINEGGDSVNLVFNVHRIFYNRL